MRMMRGPLIPTIISKETVKPSSPTPSQLKTYNLSLLDQFAPSIHMPGVFFYPNSCGTSSGHEIAAQLKKSLSQTLVHYYPFAGRLVDGSRRVDCNDEGVEFVEARINARLSDVVHLHNLEYQPLDQFFPTGRVWGHGYEASSSLVVFQLSYFSCGGLALAVSISHKIGDGATFLSFLVHWAAVTRQNSGDHQALVLPPHFISSANVNGASLVQLATSANIGNNNTVITKKFVFPNSKIAQLKASVVVKDDQMKTFNPSRVELVNALLYRCAVRAAKANSSGNSAKGFVLRNVVNLRSKMIQPLPQTSVGNIYWTTHIPTRDENELALNSLCARIKKAKMQINRVTDSQISQWLTQASMNLTNDVEVYWFSSICGFPLYEVDFGLGKPIRTTVVGYPKKNVIYLMDTPTGDGIEAIVTLEEQDMAIFQNDQQLLKLAATIKPRL